MSYTCRDCPGVFSSYWGAKNHCRAKSHQRGPFGWPCPNCDRVFSSGQALYQHRGDVHMKCADCRMKFKSVGQLERVKSLDFTWVSPGSHWVYLGCYWVSPGSHWASQGGFWVSPGGHWASLGGHWAGSFGGVGCSLGKWENGISLEVIFLGAHWDVHQGGRRWAVTGCRLIGCHILAAVVIGCSPGLHWVVHWAPFTGVRVQGKRSLIPPQASNPLKRTLGVLALTGPCCSEWKLRISRLAGGQSHSREPGKVCVSGMSTAGR
ncbi:hypothetical protein DFP72DRAFT_859734 [Ephemerocybe angulata]|uniref:C2H2-type domain-containing protein n=1 Tax=Ephemerocybe angulata TaxID=980116 RepID=A0A8H6LUQ1_9AGAR|nr:hypothetical protein DFP72DRAFT_859734 [Tulosesus angulatus]